MSKVYKVIWFDDEHRELKKIRESAHLKGITLIGFGNAEEGINELKNNIKAIILTSSADNTDLKKSKTYPNIVNYIQKPLTREKIEKIPLLMKYLELTE